LQQYAADTDAKRVGQAAEGRRQRELFDAVWKEYDPTVSVGEERRIADALLAAWTAYKPISERYDALVANGETPDGVAAFLNQMSPKMQALRAAIQADLDLQLEGSKVAAEDGVARGRAAYFWILAGLVAIGVLTLAIGWTMARSIARPVSGMTAAMRRLADHDLTVTIPGIGRGDEIGAMAEAVGVFRDAMARADQLTAEQASMKAEAEAARRAAMHATADDFEAKVGGLVALISNAATELQATAQSMESTATGTGEQA